MVWGNPFKSIRKELKRTVAKTVPKPLRRPMNDASSIAVGSTQLAAAATIAPGIVVPTVFAAYTSSQQFYDEFGVKLSAPVEALKSARDYNKLPEFPDTLSQFLGESFVDEEDEEDVEFGGTTSVPNAPGSRASTLRTPVNTGLRIGSGTGGLNI